eukprot:5254849-Pyramimonas_sp.AAC.1
MRLALRSTRRVRHWLVVAHLHHLSDGKTDARRRDTARPRRSKAQKGPAPLNLGSPDAAVVREV